MKQQHSISCGVCVLSQGIEQIKNLDFDELPAEEAPRQPPSSTATSTPAPPPPIAHFNDPWGVPAAEATATTASTAASVAPASSLSDLQGLMTGPTSSNPFGMPDFSSMPAPNPGMAAPGFGAMGMPFGVPSSQVGPRTH
jgi:hypothetical protein